MGTQKCCTNCGTVLLFMAQTKRQAYRRIIYSVTWYVKSQYTYVLHQQNQLVLHKFACYQQNSITLSQKRDLYCYNKLTRNLRDMSSKRDKTLYLGCSKQYYLIRSFCEWVLITWTNKSICFYDQEKNVENNVPLVNIVLVEDNADNTRQLTELK